MTEKDQEDLGIQEQAVEWLRRLFRPDSHRYRPSFKRWYGACEQHRREFLLAYIVDSQLGQIRSIPADRIRRLMADDGARSNVISLNPATREQHSTWARSRRSPLARHPRLIAGTACVFLCAGVALALPWSLSQHAHRATYSTDIGEYRRIQLDDGTLVELNTHSEIVVRYTQEARAIDLVQGEALFTVAADPRQFRVTTNHARIEDIGTRFSVHRSADATGVVVAEGRVRVGGVELKSGESATISPGTVAPTLRVRLLSREQVGSALAWTEGYLELSGQTLAEVVAQLNRYQRRPLVIADASLQSVQLGGRVSTHDLRGFISALGTFGITVVESDAAEGSADPLLLLRADKGSAHY